MGGIKRFSEAKMVKIKPSLISLTSLSEDFTKAIFSQLIEKESSTTND